MKIREANLDDAHGIGKVHVDAWRTTYKNIISDRFLNNLSYDKRRDLWIHNISQEDNYIFIAENENNEIIGFATGTSEKSGDFPGYDADVTSIYILVDYQGQGIGEKLLIRLFQKFLDLGYRSSVVWVLADNQSRFFYEKMGAEIILDNKPIKIGDDTLIEVAYGWKDISKVV